MPTRRFFFSGVGKKYLLFRFARGKEFGCAFILAQHQPLL
jgi:hypothetical protein